MQRGIYDRKVVRPSVYPSVKPWIAPKRKKLLPTFLL